MRAETESAKAPVDFATLQLHNLMYEKNHYLKAIKACNDFKTKYPDIDLVPEEEFFGSAPEEIKGKVLASDAAHDLMLKRLNFELLQVCFASCTILCACAHGGEDGFFRGKVWVGMFHFYLSLLYEWFDSLMELIPFNVCGASMVIALSLELV